jgi:hypothetical protein
MAMQQRIRCGIMVQGPPNHLKYSRKPVELKFRPPGLDSQPLDRIAVYLGRFARFIAEGDQVKIDPTLVARRPAALRYILPCGQGAGEAQQQDDEFSLLLEQSPLRRTIDTRTEATGASAFLHRQHPRFQQIERNPDTATTQDA